MQRVIIFDDISLPWDEAEPEEAEPDEAEPDEAEPEEAEPETVSEAVSEAKPKERKRYPADELLDLDDEQVNPLEYDIDQEKYVDIMVDLFFLLFVNRNNGYVHIIMKASKGRGKKTDREIGILMRKKSLYIVAIYDGKEVYELGFSGYPQAYFKDAKFTQFGDTYEELFGAEKFSGLQIGFEELKYSFCQIVDNAVDTDSCGCEKWKKSVGIFSLMFAEPARFVWIFDVLVLSMDYGYGSVKLDDFSWIKLLINAWGLISGKARKKKGATQPQILSHSKDAFVGLKNNGKWAWDALIYLHVDCDGDGQGMYGGGRGDAGKDGSRAGGFYIVVAEGYADNLSKRVGSFDRLVSKCDSSHNQPRSRSSRKGGRKGCKNM